MYLISEKVAAALVSIEAAIPLMESAFIDMEKGGVEHLPLAMATGPAAGSSFGAKGCIVRSMGLFGFKLGGYWPSNPSMGLPAHASTTILLDPKCGFPLAVIGAKHLSAIRTAALDAIAIRRLSRPDSQTVAIIGGGKQGWQEFLAARAVRPITRVLVWSRNPAMATAFAERVSSECSIAAEAVELETAVKAADIVITATSSTAPLVERSWVRPGTHVSAIGASNKRQQELATDLVGSSKLYADIVEQSITIGEFRTAFAQGLIGREAITPIGTVIHGTNPLRSPDDVTIFDTSGAALQDLAIAKVALDAAIERGLAVVFDEEI